MNPTPVRLVKVEPTAIAGAPPREKELGWIAMSQLPAPQTALKLDGVVHPLMVIGLSWNAKPEPWDRAEQLNLATVDLYLAEGAHIAALQSQVGRGLVAAPAQAMDALNGAGMAPGKRN